MKLAVSFLAALAVAPLAAQAAQPPFRYAVTLRATVVDQATYILTRAEEECLIRREGAGSREASFRSSRPTTISVDSRVIYRPARMIAVRVSGTSGGGSFSETRRCRAEPIRTLIGDCRVRRTIRPAAGRPGFRRPRRNAIAFRAAPPTLRGTFLACGLDQPFPAGWLDSVPGTINERALLRGAALVRARGVTPAAVRFLQDPLVQTELRTTVRWTLTFRRLP